MRCLRETCPSVAVIPENRSGKGKYKHIHRPAMPPAKTYSKMETTEMTPERSLQIINGFIEKSRHKFIKECGLPLMMWGTLVLVTSLIIWYLWKRTGNPAWNWLWFVMAAVGFALGPLLSKRNKAYAKGFLDEKLGYLWMSYGIFSMSYALVGIFLDPLPITAGITLMLGLCISLTGILTNLKSLTVLGFVTGMAGTAACSLIKSPEDVTLVMTGMSMVTLLSGIIMYFQSKHICSRN